MSVVLQSSRQNRDAEPAQGTQSQDLDLQRVPECEQSTSCADDLAHQLDQHLSIKDHDQGGSACAVKRDKQPPNKLEGPPSNIARMALMGWNSHKSRRQV